MSITKSLSNIMLGFLKAGSCLLGKGRRLVTARTDYGEIKFYCPNNLSLWRAETLLTKEPETIEWINSFGEGCVFWDIGANVGIYSMYAALKTKANVLAFEPAASNYYK